MTMEITAEGRKRVIADDGTARYHYGIIPLVTDKRYNDLVSIYNAQLYAYERLQRDFERVSGRVDEQATRINTLRARVAELEASAIAPGVVSIHNNYLYNAGKALTNLLSFWRKRGTLGKAGPKVLAANKAEIEEAMRQLNNSLPPKIGGDPVPMQKFS